MFLSQVIGGETISNKCNKGVSVFVSPPIPKISALHNEKSKEILIYLMGHSGLRLTTWNLLNIENPALRAELLCSAISCIDKISESGGAVIILYVGEWVGLDASPLRLTMRKNLFNTHLQYLVTPSIGNSSTAVKSFFHFFCIFFKKNHKSLWHNEKKFSARPKFYVA